MLVTSSLSLAAGPFAPPAGQPGSDAVAATELAIKSWAREVVALDRGPEDIRDPLSLPVTYGTLSSALGPADVANAEHQPEPGTPGPFPSVSLGDGGSITLRFDPPIADGAGADFAVFENALNNTFLELAFVEVSSDGKDFVRFPSISCTPTLAQVGSYGSLDARNLKNLAGKYRAGFGTPFDLAELAAIAPALDRQAISYVRLIDVVGSIDPAFGSVDSLGNLINDPFPSYETTGFDLDAVGVLNEGAMTYSAWRTHWGWTESESLPEADPDGDGTVNLLEYALGSDPRQAGPSADTSLIIGANGWRALVPSLRESAGDIAIGVEFSLDCKSWELLAGGPPAFDLPAGGRDGFVRLRVTMRTP
jgi:hypothetical protein